MITGLGVDIVEIDRMRAALERHPRMKERLFSEDERAYCEKRNRPEIHYALRFAAKEAVLKALGSGFAGMRFTDVEVSRDPSGRPIPVLKGYAAALAEEYGVLEMHLSLSFTHTTAVASAVAITAEGRPKPKSEAADPRSELAVAFREAKSMLEELQPSQAGIAREPDREREPDLEREPDTGREASAGRAAGTGTNGDGADEVTGGPTGA